MKQTSDYWNLVAEAWQDTCPDRLWRFHSDAVNSMLFAEWATDSPDGTLLKTDMFDESFGRGITIPMRLKSWDHIGMDISTEVLNTARKYTSRTKMVGADVRILPFSDESIDLIFSNSTLDHFKTQNEIVTSLQEFYRVLKSGGCLIVTIDNPSNPVIAIRNALPYSLLNRLRIVPYYVGATFSSSRLKTVMEKTGFEIDRLSAVLHCPRIFAVVMSRILGKYSQKNLQRAYLRTLLAFEKMSRWPTRFVTGYFVAARGIKT
jgi:SAM-dependent methyltransferase